MEFLEGKKAPDFSLEGTDGKTHSLADYHGKTLIIYFYPRDNTPGCTKEACSFRDLHSQFQGLDVHLLGVSKDSMASHDRFITKFGLPFTLLSDPTTKMMQDYGAIGEKLLYGKTALGVIRSTVLINPEGIVEKQWKPVKKAANHPQEILDYLKGRS